MTDMSGQTVAITGASRGIGAATAELFAAQGAHVILAARTEDAVKALAEKITNAGGAATAVACDVAAENDVKAMINAAIDTTNRLDVLINNAGLIDPIARIEKSDPDLWGHVVDVNLKGVYYGIRHAVPQMLTQGSGTIINISSGAATGALEGWSHYCATKAAVLSLTKCADKEFREHGIRVLGLSPGTVATEMQVQIKASGINPVSQLDPSVHIPADWVAKGLSYLTTPASDAYLGTDFSLKTNEGRAAIGLPGVS